MTRKSRILTLLGWYLPGYKSGGPLRTIANMVEHLGDEFDFWIVTRDRDLGDTSPYAGIKPNDWQSVNGAMVCYLPPESCTVNNMARLISTTQHDVLYLNSFFDPIFTLKPLLARMLGQLPNNPVIIAPRGEFSSNALQIRSVKKDVFIKLACLFGLFRNITWHASSEYEAQDILKLLRVKPDDIHVALDLPTSLGKTDDLVVREQPFKEDNCLKLVFLSRISPMKNLDYALKVLSKVTSTIAFDIYGPAEDPAYWQYCQNLLDKLPKNVSVRFLGSVGADQVTSIFSMYDLFFFPTRGENYGHVIAESLSVGTPVLVSDKTPWRNLHADRLGWDVSLDDADCFVKIIDECSAMDLTDRNEWRKHVKNKVTERLSNPLVFEANRNLFRRVTKKYTGGLL
jgi:glycosyltransferase involved in cell wall biosynthesis